MRWGVTGYWRGAACERLLLVLARHGATPESRQSFCRAFSQANPVMPNPRISIVTPSYNQGRFLAQCIDSVLDQGIDDLEYIVMDGGSTDETLDILRSYDDRVNWTSEPDGGQSAAINAGFRKTTGDIVAWLNSDDFYEPGALRHVLDLFDANPDADMVYGNAWMIDEAGTERTAYPTFDLDYNDLKRTCFICQPSVFLRRRVLEDVGLLNERLHVCLDYEWWLRILREHKGVFCEKPLACSRHYDETKTSSRRLRALVEAGYVQRMYFGEASWRWSAKWVVHRWTMRRSRFVLPVVGWWSALASASRFRQRFMASREPSRYGRRLMRDLGR